VDEKSPLERAESLVGQRVGGRYLLEAVLGYGSSGGVYRASDRGLTTVALKILDPSLLFTDVVHRFEREAHVVTRLRSEHVIPTLAAGEDTTLGVLYLMMPLLQGRDLDSVLSEHGALEPEIAVRIAIQAARGIGAAHALGIIHRDVKPGNLFLDTGKSGQAVVKVCDFGLAKRIGSADVSLTSTGSQLGTPDYVSPEQLRNAKAVDERADIWGLGATLYEMLCGTAPFGHIDTLFDLIAATCSEDVIKLRERAPWINARLAAVVERSLRRDPAQRFASMREFAEALAPFAGGKESLSIQDVVSVSAEKRNGFIAELEFEVPKSSKRSAAVPELAAASSLSPELSELNAPEFAALTIPEEPSILSLFGLALVLATVGALATYFVVYS
jgi:serine/threonine protein kinase